MIKEIVVLECGSKEECIDGKDHDFSIFKDGTIFRTCVKCRIEAMSIFLHE